VCVRERERERVTYKFTSLGKLYPFSFHTCQNLSCKEVLGPTSPVRLLKQTGSAASGIPEGENSYIQSVDTFVKPYLDWLHAIRSHNNT